MADLVIYTDGACKGNPGRGGWGVYIEYGDITKSVWGGAAHVTNNQMELQAIIEAFKLITKPQKITICSDSNYVLQGITTWTKNWIRNGWRSAAGTPVKNKELWVELLDLRDSFIARGGDVNWQWVRGHNGNHGNEMADQLANNGVNSIKNV